jgi:hypothetical protein
MYGLTFYQRSSAPELLISAVCMVQLTPSNTNWRSRGAAPGTRLRAKNPKEEAQPKCTLSCCLRPSGNKIAFLSAAIGAHLVTCGPLPIRLVQSVGIQPRSDDDVFVSGSRSLTPVLKPILNLSEQLGIGFNRTSSRPEPIGRRISRLGEPTGNRPVIDRPSTILANNISKTHMFDICTNWIICGSIF